MSKWIELFISKGHTENTDFAFGVNVQKDPIIFKEKAADLMKKSINDDDFINILESKRGTHSIINMETTIARRCGCSKMKLIQELTVNRNINNICMLIQLSHVHMKKLLLLFVRGDQFITKSEWKVGYQSIGS